MKYELSHQNWVKFRTIILIAIPAIIFLSIFIHQQTNNIVEKNLMSQSLVNSQWYKEINLETIFDADTELQDKHFPYFNNFIVVSENHSNEYYGSDYFWKIYNKDRQRYPIVKQKVFYGKSDKYYYIGHPIQQMERKAWLIEFFPKRYYIGIEQTGLYIWTVVSLCMIILLYFGYRIILMYITRPLKDIDEGIQKVLDDDFTFEYRNNQIVELDHLGHTVTSLKDKLVESGQDLVASEQRLSILMDHLNLGVVLIGSNHRIELFNPEAEQLLNLTENSMGRSFESAIQSIVLIDMIKNVLQFSTPSNDEIEIFVPKQKYVDVNIIPFQENHEGNNVDHSVLVLLYDTSNIRKLENVRTEFVANASHELRTPVTAIKGFAETLMDGALDNPVLSKKFINIIFKESNRLESLIHDILELSRIEKRATVTSYESVDIVEIINDTIVFLSNKASLKKIKIEFNPQNEAMMIQSDPGRIKQIMINLIDNAITYSNIAKKVRVILDEKPDAIVIRIIDQGIGIPKEDQDRIFERFYRVDKGRSRNSGGTGLGLSIVKNLISLLNGQINFISEVGIGTEFVVTLPKDNENLQNNL